MCFIRRQTNKQTSRHVRHSTTFVRGQFGVSPRSSLAIVAGPPDGYPFCSAPSTQTLSCTPVRSPFIRINHRAGHNSRVDFVKKDGKHLFRRAHLRRAVVYGGPHSRMRLQVACSLMTSARCRLRMGVPRGEHDSRVKLHVFAVTAPSALLPSSGDEL